MKACIYKLILLSKKTKKPSYKFKYIHDYLSKQLVKLFFWMMEVCVDRTFFAFIGGSGLVTWPEPNTVFDIEVGNRKHPFFGRILWWEQTTEKGAQGLIAENLVVWRNFPVNKKISNGWWSSIRHPLTTAESSSWKEIFNCWPEEILSSFKFNCRVFYSEGDIYNCWTEEILSSCLPWNCYAMNTEIMNAEHEAGWCSPLQDSS